jgi:serine/threonine-protein kinase
VHRDVSPQNVIVGADGIARIVDFGLAKAAGRQRVTLPGQMLGKLGYMSPEQVQPQGEVTRAADVYATGVVLWELIAGRRLFPNDGYEIPSLILQGVIEPPSLHRRRRDETLRTEEMAVTDRLDAIVLRAIDRDPSRRYPTARQMAEEVESAIAAAPQSAVGAWVETLAMDALSERTARVAEIERHSVRLDSVPRPMVTAPAVAARRGALRVGDTAPDIDAMTTTGARFVLSSPRACTCTVIYFFPKAFTPLCEQETRLFGTTATSLASRARTSSASAPTTTRHSARLPRPWTPSFR